MEEIRMKWIKPEFKHISLCMEVTSYSNTDVSVAEAKAVEARKPAPAKAEAK